MPNRAFISYGHADAEALALRLEADLTSAGIDVWLDKSALRAGRSWEEQIERQILDRGTVVSLLTPHAVRRPDGVCLDEISFARYNNCRIVPLMVKPCQPPLGIYRLDWIDFQAWENAPRYKAGLERLTKAITSSDARVEGEHARIIGALRPLDFGVEVGKLTRTFTGREWLFDDIRRWLSTDTTRLFLITGNPGTGKSAIMAWLTTRHPAVCASHFCVSSLSDSLNPIRFASSIAAQLATQLGDYRAALDAVNLEGLQGLDANTLWRRLIAEPLSQIVVNSPVVITVDALDEARGSTGISIPKLLRDQLESLPQNVRFIVTTRKEPEILDDFSEYAPCEIAPSSAANQRDIRSHIEGCLKAPTLAQFIAAREVVAADLINAITDRADGNFLYVTQAMIAIESGRLDPRYPEEFPDGLVGIYQRFFERLFKDDEAFTTFRPLLEILCAGREALTSEQIARFLGRDNSFAVERALEQVAAFFPEFEHRYRPYHKSIVDWLTGQVGRSRRFRVDVQAGHRLIADALMQDFERGSREPFVFSHLPAHLFHAGRTDAVDALLGNPAFVLAKAGAGMYQAAIDDYELATAAELQTVREALILSSHIATSRTNELPAQLRGRLLGFTEERLVNFVDRAQTVGSGLLQPQTASLIPPGGPLARIIPTRGGVHGIAIGKIRGRSVIASADWGPDHTVHLWDMTTGDPVGKPLAGHSEVVNAVVFARLVDGTPVIASTGNDKTVRLWDAETGRPLEEQFEPLDGAVRGLVFVEFKGAPALLAVSAYGTQLLDLTSRKPYNTHKYGGLAAYATMPDGHGVVVSMSKENDRDIVIEDAESRQQRGSPLVGHRLPISALAVGTMPNGEQVIASGGFDATVRLWRLEGGEEIATFRDHAAQYEDEWDTLYANRAIEGLAFGEFDGVRCLVSGSGDRTIRLWNLETLREFRPPLTGHDYGINAIVCGYLGDSGVIVSGSDDETIRIWKPLRTAAAATRADRCTGSVSAMAVAQVRGEGVVLTGSSDGTVRVASVSTGRFLGPPLAGLNAHVRTVTIATTNVPIALAGAADGTIWIWNLLTRTRWREPIVVDSGQEVWSVRIIEILGDPMIVSTAGYREPVIQRWPLTGDFPIRPLHFPDIVRATIPALAVGQVRDKRVLVAARQDDSLFVWEPLGRSGFSPPFVGHTGWTDNWNTLAMFDAIDCGELHDGTPIILCPNVDRTIRVVSLENGSEVLAPLTGHTELVVKVRFGYLNRRPMCVSASGDATVRLWDLTTGEQVAGFTADAPVLCCAIDSEGGTVLAGDHSGAIHILKPSRQERQDL